MGYFIYQLKSENPFIVMIQGLYYSIDTPDSTSFQNKGHDLIMFPAFMGLCNEWLTTDKKW